jgi:hypothetical protein
MHPVALAHRQVADAAAAYEARWTLRALLTHDKDLYDRFRAQQQDWSESLIAGDDVDIRAQTGGMCRAWAAIATAMDEAEVPDDAYLVGADDASGVMVAISDQKASRARVEELYGDRIIFMAPCEVATLLGRSEIIAMLKGTFAGSELVK